MQKDVKPHIVLIDGVKYYSDKPETCRSCFFWKNRKVPCILGQENCYYLAEIIQSEQQKKCEDCCYASGRSCVSATCYKDLMAQFNASKNKEKLTLQLVPSAKNKNLLTDIPHRNIEDMALAYRFDMGHNERTFFSIVVTNKMLDAYGISAAQLHDDTLEAASHSCPATLRNMNEVIRNMAGQTDPSPMWVASIENGQNGACVIQYPHFLDDAAETLGGSFYVLPSSIHEVLLLADDTSPSLSELENMVRTINQAEVAPEERLSDNVFHYDCESHIFENARTFEARLSAVEQSVANTELFEAAKPDTMTVLLVQPNAYPRVVQIGTALEDLQHAVDGDIEAVYPFEDSVGVICNEEGKLRGLPANRALRDEDGHIYDVIAALFWSLVWARRISARSLRNRLTSSRRCSSRWATALRRSPFPTACCRRVMSTGTRRSSPIPATMTADDADSEGGDDSCRRRSKTGR